MGNRLWMDPVPEESLALWGLACVCVRVCIHIKAWPEGLAPWQWQPLKPELVAEVKLQKQGNVGWDFKAATIFFLISCHAAEFGEDIPRAIRAGASLHAVPCFTTGSWGAKRTWMCEGLHLSRVVNVNWDARSAPHWWQHGDICACSMMWLAQAFPHQLCSPLSTAQLINSLYIKV